MLHRRCFNNNNDQCFIVCGLLTKLWLTYRSHTMSMRAIPHHWTTTAHMWRLPPTYCLGQGQMLSWEHYCYVYHTNDKVSALVIHPQQNDPDVLLYDIIEASVARNLVIRLEYCYFCESVFALQIIAQAQIWLFRIFKPGFYSCLNNNFKDSKTCFWRSFLNCYKIRF